MALVADKLLGQVLGVRPGERVCLVRDSDASGPLAETLIRAAQKAGTDPVSLMMSPRACNGAELPEPVAGAFLHADVIINLARTGLAHTRAATAALRTGARLGNLRSFEDGVLDSPGVLADYALVKRNALAMDVLLENATEVHLATADGTDLTMQLCGREGRAQTGFATAPGSFSGLPDGESTVAPLEGTTQGRLVSPYTLDKIGLVDEPFVLEIQNGWIGRVEGGKQAQALRRLLESADENARRAVSQFALGMNPDCRLVPSMREVSKKLGTVHVALGDNITLGGTVQSDVHLDIVILNATVSLDGRVVLQGGNLYLG
jgi:leucyl aminopeptidase (aminopeptidase T)